MWRRRERYIGGYDPEHEMPDPDRGPGDRWQSPAYRRNARDTRYPYRWNPNRVEEQFGGRGPEDYASYLGWHRDARDMRRYPTGPRYDYDRGYGLDRGYDYDRGYGLDRGYDYDRGYGLDRGYDYDRGLDRRPEGYYYEGEFGAPRESDWDDRDRYERERFGYGRWRR